jgi:hypothetical protein
MRAETPARPPSARVRLGGSFLRRYHLPPRHSRYQTSLSPLRFTGTMLVRGHSSSCNRHAILDCSDHSSMKPGDAAWENSPPDWANDARLAS